MGQKQQIDRRHTDGNEDDTGIEKELIDLSFNRATPS